MDRHLNDIVSNNAMYLLAFGAYNAHSAHAIFVVACLPATRPVPGRSFKVIHNTQIVRFRVRLVRGILLWRPNNGYWNR